MLKILYASLLLLGMISEGGATEAYLRFDSYNYAEPTSINSFLNEFNGSFEGGTQAFAHEWLETGARVGDWELGIFTRYDHDLTFSEDLAELYYLSTNKLALEIGKTFQLDLSTRHYKTDGLRIGRHFEIAESLNLAIGLSYLRGLQLTDGYLSGEATAISKNDYEFTFHTDYYYSEDPLFDRVVQSPDGWGYSMDLSADWRPISLLEVNLEVKDLFGRLFWQQAPHTVADASSDNKNYDDDGYVKFLSTLKGLEDYHDYTQDLNSWGSISADYQIMQDIGLLYQGDFTAETYFSGFGVRYSFNPTRITALLYYPETEVIEFNHTDKYWKIRLASDAFTLNQANLLRIAGYLSYPF